jgi:surfeit locus 1 family protein
LNDGEFLAERTVLLDNKLRGGRPGYEVVTPLRLADGIHVLVNRGWVEAGVRREHLPDVKTPSGRMRIEGVLLTRLPQPLQLGEEGKGRVRQRLDLKAFAAETGLALQSFVIEQHSAAADGLVREWPRPDAGIEKHESYALQWYSLAALAAVLGIVFSFRRVAQT